MHYIADKSAKWYSHAEKQLGSFFLMTPLLGIYPGKIKTYINENVYVHINTHKWFFIISKKLITIQTPVIGEWTNKPWLIHVIKYYTAKQRNRLLMHTITWLNLKYIRLSESTQISKDTYCIISLI